jgi:hypothetical protein
MLVILRSVYKIISQLFHYGTAWACNTAVTTLMPLIFNKDNFTINLSLTQKSSQTPEVQIRLNHVCHARAQILSILFI